MTAGSATITATFGGSTAQANVTVNTGANHLVINEVDYDQTGTDTAEFVEIFNPSAAPVDLTGKSLVFVNGSNNMTYENVDLSSGGMLPAGGFLVVAGPGVTVNPPAIKITVATFTIQNGDPDGVALVDVTQGTLIDALCYGGPMTMANVTGITGPVSLVEGTATTVKDSLTGSMCRLPDGTDTDNASADWHLCATPTPGVANTP
jgi:hypothetical protein